MSTIDYCVCDIRNRIFEKGLLKENESVKYIIENCVLLERFTGRNYTYRAMNIYSFQSEYLFCRKISLSENDLIVLADTVRLLEINTCGPVFKLTKEERAKLLISKIFTDILPKYGFILRKSQLELSLKMFEGFINDSISLMEAAVGSGKTFAYIITAVIHNQFFGGINTVIISTSTIALQKAVTAEYIPLINDILLSHKIIVKPLKFAVRKGKSHYLCLKRIQAYINSKKGVLQQDEIQLATLVSERRLIDLDDYALSRYIKGRICVNYQCNKNCMYYHECGFILMSEAYLNQEYDFQITNHNYVMANFITQMMYGTTKLLPRYNAIIFDEAHKLYDVAKQMYGLSITENEVSAVISSCKISNLSELNTVSVISICNRIELCNDKIFENLLSQIPDHSNCCEHGRFSAQISTVGYYYIRQLIEALSELNQYILSCNNEHIFGQGKIIRRMVQQIISKISVLANSDQLICWIEKQGKINALCALPKRLNEILSQHVWNVPMPYILTSGTISVKGNFDLLKIRTGISQVRPERIIEMNKPSPFDFRKNTLIYIPEHIPFPNIKEPKYIEAVIQEIETLIRVSHGHSLVLFTSYWLMERVYNTISSSVFPFPLYIMEKGRLDILSNYKKSRNGVLFASDSCGEGIDIAGDTLSNLIIVKLPFSVPDPIAEYEQSIMGGLDVYLANINTPNMLIKLKQYAGRLIRTETDTGVLCILDSRVNNTGKYRNIVLSSLFSTTVSNDIDVVKQFLHRKKDASYFE